MKLIKLLNQREEKTVLVLPSASKTYNQCYQKLKSTKEVRKDLLIEFISTLLTTGYFCADNTEQTETSPQQECLKALISYRNFKKNVLFKEIIDAQVSFATKILYLEKRNIRSTNYHQPNFDDVKEYL